MAKPTRVSEETGEKGDFDDRRGGVLGVILAKSLKATWRLLGGRGVVR